MRARVGCVVRLKGAWVGDKKETRCPAALIAGRGLCRSVRISLVWLGLVVALALPIEAQAAPVDDAIRQQEQIQQQQEQRRLELEREHREMLDRPPSGDDLRLPEVPEAAPDAPCFEAESIELSGVTLLSQREVDGLIAPYLGRCLTLNGVNALVRDITNAYIDKGYVTTRAAIPEQDFSSGRLVILVMEGRVESIGFKGDAGRVRELKGAFPGLADGPLNLRDIEQGLDQMNRLPSNNATMELVPGEEPGGSRVVVSNVPSRTWRFSAGLDNSGQDSTGRNQYVLSFGKDNLLGVNDLLSVTVNGDSEAWTNDEHQKSATYNAFYSVPVGCWTFSGSLSHYDYRTAISSGGTDYSSYGDTTTTVLSVDRVLRRDQDSKTSLGASITHRDIQNYFNGVKLASTSQVLSSLGASLNHSHRVLGGIASAQAGYTYGVPILGAKRDRNPSLDTPRAQFSKVTVSGSFYRPFRLDEANFSWSTRFSGQWSPHTLYSAERMSIGSRYTVRGFHDDSLGGDIGGYVRNELALTMPDVRAKSPAVADWIGTMQLYAGYDAGFIRRDPKEAEEQGSLQGAALGLRTSGGRLLMDVSVSRPLDAPAFLNKRELEFYSSIQYAF